MAAGFNPLEGMSPEDIAYFKEKENAKIRREKAWSGRAGGDDDDNRRLAAEAHRLATMKAAGVTPADLADTRLPDEPFPAASASLFKIMKAVRQESSNLHNPLSYVYAPDWNSLKPLIMKFDGTWVVERSEFPMKVPLILGFFEIDGWEYPFEAKKEEFEVIVKDGRAFRADPE